MQVALQPAALGVAHFDDVRPRCGELLVGVGVGQRLRDEIGEVAQSLLETRGQCVGRGGRRRQHPPQPPADADRRRDGGAIPKASDRLGQGAAHLLVALHALRVAGPHHLRDDRVAIELELDTDREPRRAVLAPSADDRRRMRFAVVLKHARARESQQTPDLFRHLLEHPARRGLAGDEGRHPPQSRLLVGERALSRVGGRQRPGCARALGGHRGQHEGRDRRRRDEELCREQAVGERVAHERPVALRGVPDGDRADDEDRRGGAPRAEAQRRPQQYREDDVGDIALRRQLGQQHESDDQDRALDQIAPAKVPPSQSHPREQDRRDHQDAGPVAEDPGPKHAPEFVRRDDIAEAQRRSARRRR